MNYKHMRLILIILLIVINVFLGANYIYTVNEDIQIESTMIENQLTVLEKRNITIDSSLLNFEITDKNNHYYTKISSDVIVKMLNENVEQRNSIFVSEEATAKISTDGSFSILFNAMFTLDELEKLLTYSGFDLTSAEVKTMDEITSYTFKINDIPVSNAYFEVILNDRSTSILGNFLFDYNNTQSLKDDYTIFAILLEITNNSFVTGEIVDIKNSYELVIDENSDSNLEINPVVNVYFSDFYVKYNLSTNTYQRLELW